jgi:hypothetical protein
MGAANTNANEASSSLTNEWEGMMFLCGEMLSVWEPGVVWYASESVQSRSHRPGTQTAKRALF